MDMYVIEQGVMLRSAGRPLAEGTNWSWSWRAWESKDLIRQPHRERFTRIQKHDREEHVAWMPPKGHCIQSTTNLWSQRWWWEQGPRGKWHKASRNYVVLLCRSPGEQSVNRGHIQYAWGVSQPVVMGYLQVFSSQGDWLYRHEIQPCKIYAT